MLIIVDIEIKDNTDRVRSSSYLDIHLTIDSGDRVAIKFCNTKDDFNGLIMKFPFIYNNTPAALVYGVYISRCYYISELVVLIIISMLDCCCYYKEATETGGSIGYVEVISWKM